MLITLKQSHIEAAIRAYVAKAGISFEIDEMNFTAGRGKDGMTATIEMQDPFSVEAEGDTPEPKAKRETSSGFGQTVTPKTKKVEAEPLAEKTPEPETEVPEDVEAGEEVLPAHEKAPPFAQEEEDEKPAPVTKKEKASLFS